MGHSSLAQHLEVVAQCALRHRCLHGATRLLLPIRQRTDDLQPDGITESVKHVWQGDLVDTRVVKRPHTVVRTIANIRRPCFHVRLASPARVSHTPSTPLTALRLASSRQPLLRPPRPPPRRGRTACPPRTPAPRAPRLRSEARGRAGG